MAPLRIAFFGTDSRFSLSAFNALAAQQQIVATILPRAAGLRASLVGLAGLRKPSALERAAHALRIPTLRPRPERRDATAEHLRALRPDLICIALFPRLIPGQLIDVAPLGAINLHPSLLPRHRGPLPLFWTYHANDPVAGVTVHRATQHFDAGDIVLQQNIPLPRGYPVAELDADVARHGAALIASAATMIGRGEAPARAQDEGAATYAPRIKPGAAMVDFEQWDVERVWHFLAGLCPRFREPLTDRGGRRVPYQQVAGFERGAAGTPGSVDVVDRGWKLYCHDGTVLLI